MRLTSHSGNKLFNTISEHMERHKRKLIIIPHSIFMLYTTLLCKNISQAGLAAVPKSYA